MPGVGSGGRWTWPGFVGVVIGLMMAGLIILVVHQGWTFLLLIVGGWAGSEIGDAVDKRLREPPLPAPDWAPPPPGDPPVPPAHPEDSTLE